MKASWWVDTTIASIWSGHLSWDMVVRCMWHSSRMVDELGFLRTIHGVLVDHPMCRFIPPGNFSGVTSSPFVLVLLNLIMHVILVLLSTCYMSTLWATCYYLLSCSNYEILHVIKFYVFWSLKKHILLILLISFLSSRYSPLFLLLLYTVRRFWVLGNWFCK